MAGFTVTSNSDDINDTGSLRYALSQAKDGDTINFDSALTGGQTILLNSTLNVTQGVTIDGGTSGVIISGQSGAQGHFSDFTVDTGATATIEKLAINDGSGEGAAGVNGSGGGADGGNAAGGIYVRSGTLNLVNDSFTNDTATGGAGALFSTPKGMGGNAAGAVYVEPTATVTASSLTFVNDTAAGGSGSPKGKDYPISNSSAVTDAATCFVTGTFIHTVHGEVAIEQLSVGDIVVTTSGAQRPIRWIGHSTLRPADHPAPWTLHPVRIAAQAFGVGQPARDLLLSPGHPVLVGADANGAGGHLVPIMCLINGTTIERVAVDEVTYWHVELDAHDILLAEGLPAESYLDWGDRDFFAEGADHRLANPDFVVPGLAGRCRPVAVEGPVVEAERRRLDMVFATRLAQACAWPDERVTL